MDAQRNEAVTPSHNEPNLDVLAEQWLQQKTLEDNCKARRIEIEQQMIPHLAARAEGSQTTETTFGRKIKLTTKNNYKLDDIALQAVRDSVPANMLPLKLTQTIDVARLKYLRNNEPAIYREIARAFSHSPAKPNIQITGGEI